MGATWSGAKEKKGIHFVKIMLLNPSILQIFQPETKSKFLPLKDKGSLSLISAML